MFTSHEMASEIYYELKKKLKYSDEVIPDLLEDIVNRYDKLSQLREDWGSRLTKRKTLAAAIFLTCRGQYICPVNMKKYPRFLKKEGGFTKVCKLAEKIGESVRYSPDEMINNSLEKLKKQSVITEDIKKRVLELYQKDKENRPMVTRSYVGGLVDLLFHLESIQKTHKEISNVLQITNSSIENSCSMISKRLKIKI